MENEPLFDDAAQLAYQAFDEPTDGHINGVLERLKINHCWGLGDAGAVTVH